MMKCFECDETCEIKKYKAFNYTSVNLDNIVLMNIEVEVCAACKTETPLLRNVKKLHDAIGVAIALQKVHLSGADIRYLRRSAGFQVGEWITRLNVAEGTYSKWENGHRSITPQADRLARINYLNALKQKDPENVRLARYLDAVLNIKIAGRKDFVIAINAERPETEAKYLPEDSPLLAKPEVSVVEAKTLPPEPQANVVIICGHHARMSALDFGLSLDREKLNVSDNFTLAA